MVTEQERQWIVDGEHLKMLSIIYWVWGAMIAVYSLFAFGYFAFLGFIFTVAPSGSPSAPPEWFGTMFLIMGLVLLVITGTLSAFVIMAGFWVRDRKHRIGTIVVAALLTPSIPIGTMIGVSSFIVLLRPSVKALYEAARPAIEQPAPAPLTQ